MFDACPGLDGDVVELAAGTGQWTARLVARGARVTALDASPEMLAIAQSRCGGVIETEVVDLLSWSPARTWDALVACFWLSHVPDGSFGSMLTAMAAAVRPGGAVFLADKAVGKVRTARTLRDGRRFEVVDRVRPVDELSAAFGAAGFDVAIDTVGSRWIAIHGPRRGRSRC